MIYRLNLILRSMLVLYICTWISGSDVYAEIQHSGSFPAESLAERMERLNELGKEMGQSISYNRSELSDERTPGLTVTTNNMEEWLYKSLENSDYTYEKKNNNLYLVVKEIKETMSQSSQTEQTKEVRGIVTDMQGTPLIGVNVVQKGTTNGTVTDLDGKFAFQATPNSMIVFTYIGFTKQEVAWDGKSSMNVTLSEDTELLDEVVVVGYGTQKKANLTGATSTVNFQNLESRPVANTATLLQGQLPGVTVGNFNTQPGNDKPDIKIRGIGTFNAGQNPLIIVDGVETDFSQIPTSDIESISVLKDAASSAIYGVRAANGVIIVTTKRGTAQKAVVTVKQNFALQEAAILPDMVDSWDYARIINTARSEVGQSPLYTDEMIQKMKNGSDPDHFANTDWVEELFQVAPMNTTYMSVNGGTDKTRFLISGEYFNQVGISKGTDTRRYNFRSNLDTKVNDWLSMGMNLSGNFRKTNETLNSSNESGGNSSIFYQMRRTSNPLVPVKYGNGEWGTINGVFDITSATYPNAVYMSQRGENFTDRYHLHGKVFADIALFKKLKYTVNLSAVYNSSLNTRFEPTQKLFKPNGDILSENSQNALQNNNNTDYRYIIENLFNYDLSLNNHQFNFLLGQAAQFYRSDYMWAAVKGLPNDYIHELSAGVIEKDVAGDAQEEALHSLFGRVNYNYMDKYLFEANIRGDQTSRFPSENRLGVFPSFSVGWVLSNESFLKESGIIQFLKLRASWGQLGNQEVGYYPYAQMINLGQDYVFGEELNAGAALTNLANDKIKWETTIITNIGLDVNLFKNRLQFVVDVFDKTSQDILATLPVPSTLGNLGAPFQNIAKVRNRGLEGAVTFRNNYKEFNYSIGLNVSKLNNKIMDIANLETWIYNGGRNINFTGYPIGSYYGLVAEGYFRTEEEIKNSPVQFSPLRPGDIKFKDIGGPNGVPDGKIDETYDRTIIGNPFPKLSYAFNLGGNYKGFDLYCFFQGVSSVDRYFWYNNEDVGNFTTSVLDYWRPDNMDAAYPRFGNQTNNNKNSTQWIQDASYLRLKNLEFGYTVPSSISNSVGIQNIRVYLSGNNLITLTGLRDFDPEKTLEDDRNRVYPQSKIYSAGLTLTF